MQNRKKEEKEQDLTGQPGPLNMKQEQEIKKQQLKSLCQIK